MPASGPAAAPAAKRFRYRDAPVWRKGNCHVHSTGSDGTRTPDELAALYAGAGYDFLFRTEHWTASRVAEEAGDPPLLWIDGVELDGRLDGDGPVCHVLCLGTCPALPRGTSLAEAAHAARAAGAVTVLAHPRFLGNRPEDALRLPLDGVEVFSLSGAWKNGKADSSLHWEALLDRDPAAIGLAVDDTHFVDSHPGWDGGWIVADVPALTRDGVLGAIRAGRFYASTGPAIHALAFDGEAVRVACTPARSIRLVGPGPLGRREGGPDRPLVEEARFPAPLDWPWARVEVEDDRGRRAWTNALFLPDA